MIREQLNLLVTTSRTAKNCMPACHVHTLAACSAEPGHRARHRRHSDSQPNRLDLLLRRRLDQDVHRVPDHVPQASETNKRASAGNQYSWLARERVDLLDDEVSALGELNVVVGLSVVVVHRRAGDPQDALSVNRERVATRLGH